MSTTLSEVNAVLNSIHNVVQKSGLHFVINQTPWSSYITIRKKFTSPGPYAGDDGFKDMETVVNDEVTALSEHNAQMEEKNEKKVADLYSKIDTLENSLEETRSDMENKMVEIQVLSKEKKIKDEIIKNLNAVLLKKGAECDLKVKELENFKKQTIKSERKALKKLRQKSEKEAVRNNIESDVEAVKNTNNNFPDTEDTANILAKTKLQSNLFSSPVRQSSPVWRSPSNPPSPRTPPGLPQQAAASLSGYFVDSAPNLLQAELKNLVESSKKPKIGSDYIKTISKINLVPRMERN